MFEQIGYSTGALVPESLSRSLKIADRLNSEHGMKVLEISFLREPELFKQCELFKYYRYVHGGFMAFRHVSIHAPSKYEDEKAVTQLIQQHMPGIPVVVHPDAIQDLANWKPLGARLMFENMDNRKVGWKTAGSLLELLRELPNAGICFDVGHAIQVDYSGEVAIEIAAKLGSKIRQLHVSAVYGNGQHAFIIDSDGPHGVDTHLGKIWKYLNPQTPCVLEVPSTDSLRHDEQSDKFDLSLRIDDCTKQMQYVADFIRSQE
jgi:hypothetical protein